MSDDPRVGLGALLADGADGLRPRLVDLLPGPWHRREVGDTPVDEPGPDVRAADLYDFEDEGLVQAAMAALVLGQPMIIAGEPGVGKTQFASALAARLRLAMQPTFVELRFLASSDPPDPPDPSVAQHKRLCVYLK